MKCNNVTFDALVDSGAFTSAIPISMLSILQGGAESCIKLSKVDSHTSVKVASGAAVPVLSQAQITFQLGSGEFVEKFLVLAKMNTPILGLPFLRENGIVIDFQQKLLKLPDMTLQLNEIQDERGKRQRIKRNATIDMYTTQKITVQPNRQEILTCEGRTENAADITGVVEPVTLFENKTGLCLTSAISTLDSQKRTELGVLNPTPIPITILPGTKVATLTVLTPKQAEYLTPLDPRMLAAASDEHELNEIAKIAEYGNQIPEILNSPYWFPTPEHCTDPGTLEGVPKRIYDEIVKRKEMEQLDPARSEAERKLFLSKIPWQRSILTEDEKQQVEDLLIEFSDIFSKHDLDIGVNHDFKIKLRAEHDRPVYTQCPPAHINMKDEILVRLALLEYFGVIQTLPFSKYSSPIFAQRKPNGSLRILIDLRKINHLIRHDYDTNNFPIATLADAGNHLAGKKYFCTLDCSQAYYTLQMADEASIQMLAFNFAGRTFAFRRLAQGLSRSVSAFSSYMKKYMDPCIAADKCFQYVDDLGTAANSVRELIDNLRCIFHCLRAAGLKLSMHKCEFGLKKISFLGRTITEQGISPNQEKAQAFLKTLKMPKSVKQVKRLIGFFQYFKVFIPNLTDKLLEFYKLTRTGQEFIITEDHHKAFDELKLALEKACTMSLRLPLPDKQYVILADASYYASGFVLMIEDYTKDQKNKDVKVYAPVTFGSRIFTPAQMNLSPFAKEFLAVHHALDFTAHTIWGATKPILILTDNKALSRFFQAKQIPSALWNAVDHMMSFNFILGHIPGKANAAADFLSRMHINPDQKYEMRIKSQLRVHEVQIDLVPKTPDNSITELAEELHSSEDDEENILRQLLRENDDECSGDVVESATKFWIRKAEVNVLEEQDIMDIYDLTNKTKQLNMTVEQYKDRNLAEVIRWVNGERVPDTKYGTVELQKYLKQLPRLEIHEGVLYRKFFDDTGRNFIRQICIPKHLREELLYRIHNSPFKGHIGMEKTAQEFRSKFYFPGFTEYLLNHIRNCKSCLQVKSIKKSQITPQLQSVSVEQSFPGDMLQVDLVGKLKPSGGFTHILTAMDVFTKYMFAVPIVRADAGTVARVLRGIFMKHCYLPQVILSDMGSVFTSRLMKELTDLLEIELRHATVKHAQTIGLLERSHAELKRVLNIHSTSGPRDWHKYVDIACFAHNTTYHTKLQCTPALLFFGRQPVGPLDLRFQNKALKRVATRYDSMTDFQDQLLDLYERNKENILIAYQKYRRYYDMKAQAKPLKLHSYCMILNPALTSTSDAVGKNRVKWIPTYRVEQVLTNNNYIVRKTNTNYTQCVHRIRLKPFTPHGEVEDLELVDRDNFLPDPQIRESEPKMFDKVLQKVLQETPPIVFEQASTPDKQEFLTQQALQHAQSPTHAYMQEPVEVTEEECPPNLPPGDEGDTPTPQNDNISEPTAPRLEDDPRTGNERRYNLRREVRAPERLQLSFSEVSPQKRVWFLDDVIHERQGDLLTNGKHLAHCVSTDTAMKAGIAVAFRRHFPRMRNNIAQRICRTGDVLPYYDRKKKRHKPHTLEKERQQAHCLTDCHGQLSDRSSGKHSGTLKSKSLCGA